MSVSAAVAGGNRDIGSVCRPTDGTEKVGPRSASSAQSWQVSVPAAVAGGNRDIGSVGRLTEVTEWPAPEARPAEYEIEAAQEELRELQRCGLRVNVDEKSQVLAAGRRLACIGRAPSAAPSPSLVFAATPASFVPVDEEAASSAELLELEACGLRVNLK